MKDIYPQFKCKSIVVITAGGNGLNQVKNKYTDVFKKDLGLALEFVVLHEHDNNEKEIYKDRLESADSIFISGGNQIEILKRLERTSFISLIQQRYKRDQIIIAGTSAGAMIMSKQMIYEGSNAVPQIDEYLKITPGIGLFSDAIIDTHFIKRGRISRLVHAMNRYPNLVGIGLEEDTAVLFNGQNGKARCFGEGTVTLIESMKSSETQHFKLNAKAISVRTAFLTCTEEFLLEKPN